MGRLHVIGAPSALTGHLAGWFAAGGLALPNDVTWEVAVHPDPWFDAPGPAAVRQGDAAVEPRPDGTLRIAHPEGVDIIVDAATPRARWVIAEELVPYMDEWLPTVGMLAVVFCLRRMGWHHLHGATAVAPDGRGWIISGPSGSGKSTTVAALARAGWRVGGDDAAFLAPAADGPEPVVYGWNGAIALRDGGRRLLALAGSASPDARGKWRADIAEHGAPLAGPFRPDVLALCEVAADGGPTRAEPMAPRDAFARLVTQTAWVALEPALAGPHLAMLERLMRRASPMRLVVAPDLVDDPNRLLRLLGT